MKELTTERLNLRRLTQEDATSIFNGWATDEDVVQWLRWDTHKDIQTTERVVQSWLADYNNPACFRWGIELQKSKELIGMIDVVEYLDGYPAIGYVLAKAHWGQGYMTESLRAVSEYLLECGFEKVLLTTSASNVASQRVAEKCGFKLISKDAEEPTTENNNQLTYCKI